MGNRWRGTYVQKNVCYWNFFPFLGFGQEKCEWRFGTIACVFPHQLNDASVIDASPTPPTIGNREPMTHVVGIYFVQGNKDNR